MISRIRIATVADVDEIVDILVATKVASLPSLIDDQDRRRLGQDTSIASSEFTATRTADYVVDLPLADLERGAYLLTMEMKAGPSIVRRDLRFVVK